MKADKRDVAANCTSNEQGRILHWNFFISGHLSASVPVRLVERTSEGKPVWMETGTPMWCTALPRGATHLREWRQLGCLR